MRLVLIYFILSATAYAGDINQVFSCKLGENRFAMHLGENGDAEVGDGTESFSGSYSYNDGIEFQFPELGYQDKSLSVEKKKGYITTFRTPTLFCHAIAHANGGELQGKVECPKIKYIPNAGYQINYFEFYPNGMVRRFMKDIIFAGDGDTLFSETYGIYETKNDKVWMFFGQEEKERELTGKLDGNGLIVNQLEPEKGACQ